MAGCTDRYDTALLGILQNEGKVAPFLDVILGFLYRRTDYFRIMETENDRLGFPPGVAQKLLLNIFRKYEALAIQDSVRMGKIKKDNEKKSVPLCKSAEQKDEDSVSKVVEQNEGVRLEPATESCVQNDEIQQKEIKPMEIDSTPPQGATAQPSENPAPKPSEEEEEDPEKARERRELQANPLTYNGADRGQYLWSQIITETDVRVKVPSHIIKGKQVNVDIQKKHIKVQHLDKDTSWLTVIDRDLIWGINREESMWTLTPGEFIHINLDKLEERWWEAVFVGEEKINTRKIDCSRPMTDLDDEAQAKIEEMMYNQRQKQLGLPQSHELKTHEMLRKAWDAEGSPFKGQPFDPSRFSVDPNGIANIKPS